MSQQFKLSQQTYESRLHTLDRELSESRTDCQRIRGQLEQLVRENESAKHSQQEKEKAAARSKSESYNLIRFILVFLFNVLLILSAEC